jgi:hypothetical protein
MVIAMVTCGKDLCVGRVVLSTRRDPRSHSNLVFQMIQDWEVKQPFGRKGVYAGVVSK